MIAGVDGCPDGWIVVTSETWPCARKPRPLLCPDFGAVLEATASCDAVVVDMPIGLPAGPVARLCDVEAREALGRDSQSRVFYAPPRGALEADSSTDFQHLHRQLAGRAAALPVWGIVPKLREVDALITPALQARVVEFHPELAWKRLAGRVLASKHRADGLLQRLNVLLETGRIDGFGIESGTLTGKATFDDILDAAVGLSVAAHVVGGEKPRRLPGSGPVCDERGLRMEIWY
ncbi:MAG: DUF429 domain-containing protein [Kiritimatiellae bacterium]|nr:DUF429 domain-containing protein [Kiritimatiellia bacterium]